MLQDYVRTSTYQRAVLWNSDDFRDKVVLDVGAGSGILSFFAVQAGARKVYAVEASSMAQHAEVGSIKWWLYASFSTGLKYIRSPKHMTEMLRNCLFPRF